MSRLDGWMAQKLGILPEQLDRSAIEQQQLDALNALLQWCKAIAHIIETVLSSCSRCLS